MRSLPVAFLSVGALFAVTSRVEARPITAGLSLGLAQSEADAGTHDPDNTLGLFGRMGLTNRLGLQLELSRSEPAYTDWKVRQIRAMLVVELRDRGSLVPILLAGVGVDEAQSAYDETVSATHVEGGLGLEYRASAGLTIGADARMGGRSMEPGAEPVVIALYAPTGLQEGEYRTARITLGVRF